jgi:hypothetical protein
MVIFDDCYESDAKPSKAEYIRPPIVIKAPPT